MANTVTKGVYYLIECQNTGTGIDITTHKHLSFIGDELLGSITGDLLTNVKRYLETVIEPGHYRVIVQVNLLFSEDEEDVGIDIELLELSII